MNRHDVDFVSLTAGLLFLGVGTAFLLDALGKWSPDITWLPAIVFIVLGAGGLLATFARQRRTNQPEFRDLPPETGG